MYLAALKQLLRDTSEDLTEDERLSIWDTIEKLELGIEAAENEIKTQHEN